jgi:hypothetical protein
MNTFNFDEQTMGTVAAMGIREKTPIPERFFK